MLILSLLLLGHFIADFTLQTNKVAQWKRVSQWGMAVHVLCHPLAYVALLWPYLGMSWMTVGTRSLSGWACVGLISLLHWIEDEWRVWAIRRGARDSTAFLFWDQAVHVAVIWAFAPHWPDLRPTFWVMPAIVIVLLAHFTSVLIYFVEHDLGIASTVLSQRKYLLMAERLLGAGLFVLPAPFYLAGFAWVGGIVARHISGDAPRSRAHLAIGLGSTILAGFSLRFLLPR